MRAFKLKYVWYEGEEGECWLCKEVSQTEFEQDIKEAKTEYVKSIVETIDKDDFFYAPDHYWFIIKYLIDFKDYNIVNIEDRLTYFVEDNEIRRRQQKMEFTNL